MRAIILEIKNEYCLVMNQSGVICKIKTIDGHSVGMNIELDEPGARRNRLFNHSYVAALAAVIFISIVMYFVDASERILVDVEINASFFVTMDKYYRVISVKDQNSEASDLLEDMEYKKMGFGSFMNEVFGRAEAAGFLSVEGTGIAIAVTSSRAGDYICNLDFARKYSNIVAVLPVTQEFWVNAVENGFSPAKYKIVTELAKDGVTIDPEYIPLAGFKFELPLSNYKRIANFYYFQIYD